jgi:hypothetical protein
MLKKSPIVLVFCLLLIQAKAQLEPNAGKWKTWLISSVAAYRLPAPGKAEVAQVLARQQKLSAQDRQKIAFWNAGGPVYRWQETMNALWMTEVKYTGTLSFMLNGVSMYDATIAAWDSKYTYRRPRPFEVDKRIKLLAPQPNSPSYPCEYSVAAGAAVEVIGHFYPKMKDSVLRMAQEMMDTRVAAGLAFPSDTKAGFDLGQKIANYEIALTKQYTPQETEQVKIPNEPGKWTGKFAYLPLAGKNKTVVLSSGSQFRPGPPPDFGKEMEELRNYKPDFNGIANAFRFASQSVWEEILDKKVLEYNLHLNPPHLARAYALRAIATYDGFTACWDAKYAYWGIRPNQYDPNFKPTLIFTPPFPGYPSGHAAMGATYAEIYSYLFPLDRALFQKTAKEAAESRFQGGIHFRSDNEVALKLGSQVGALIVNKAKQDGAGEGN